MIYGEILAGGQGTRMGNTQMPKQFLILGDKPIIIHTIEKFMMNLNFDKILVCCPKEWISYAKDLFIKYNIDKERVIIVAGGNSRHESVMNGCKYIEENYGISDNDIIVTHDAVRPFVSQRILDDNIALLEKYDAVDTVIEAIDTIIMSDDGKVISEIPNRNRCYQGQTPQSFKIKKLIDVQKLLKKEERDSLTDACKIFSLKGKSIGIVNGEVYNNKITTMHDLKIANAILMECDKL